MTPREYIGKSDTVTCYSRDPERTIYHRERGLPSVEYFDGDKIYFENDKHHRLDGFACNFRALNCHYLNGKRLFRN